MADKFAFKILVVSVLIVILIGLIAGDEGVQNISSNNSLDLNAAFIQNYSQNQINYENNSMTVPLDLVNGNAGDFPNVSANISDGNTAINSSNLPALDNSDNLSSISQQNSTTNYIPLNSEVNDVNYNPCAASNNMMNVQLVQNNKVEIKARLPDSCDINNIQKQDIIRNSTSKEIIVSSSIHVDSPLTIYTDIASIYPNQTDSVKIFWVNENASVTPTGFYDTNGDGMYDRISWTVPHLSTQIFQVNVNVNTISNPGLVVNVTSPTIGATITNQTNFNILISYSGNLSSLNCNLTIDGQNHIFNALSITNLNYNLPNGPYSWTAQCSDNLGNYSSAGGNFNVNQVYSGITVPQSIYILGQNNNLIGNPNTIINLNSNGANPDIYLYKNSQAINGYPIINYPNSSFNISQVIQTLGVGDYIITVNFGGNSLPQTQGFSVAQAYITNSSQIQSTVSSQVGVYTNLSNSVKPANVFINFGDDNQWQIATQPSDSLSHIYSSSGNYIITATVYNNLTSPFNVTLPITVLSSGSPQPPAIILISPANNQRISDTSTPTFSYNLADNVPVSNCTFYLWNESISPYPQIYTQLIGNPTINSINYVNPSYLFPDGTYGWDVICTNNAGNTTDAVPNGVYYFTITNSSGTLYTNYSYPQQSMVQDALDALSNFSSLESSYSLDQMQALNDLGITTNLTYFAKRLAQIDQDLGININYISDPAKKSQTISSETNEIQSIRASIPDSLDVSQTQEFVKNSLTTSMDQIVKTYAENNSMSLNSFQLNQMSQMNYNIQKYLTVETRVKQVNLVLGGKTQSITLVSKQINISNSSMSTIIETIPSDLSSNIVFLTKATPIGNSMYEISTDSQDWNGQIIYYFTTPLNSLDELKQSDTVLFEDFAVNQPGLTGLVFQNIAGNFSFWYYPVIIVALFIFVYAGKRTASKIQLSKWKKEENVNRVLENIERARRALKDEDNVEIAKEAYHRIKELFALVPKGFRKYAIEEIEKIRKGIDRRDIIGFVKEYEKARLQGREDDARSLYAEIKKTYKRLPKKDQERVYHKMFREKWEI